VERALGVTRCEGEEDGARSTRELALLGCGRGREFEGLRRDLFGCVVPDFRLDRSNCVLQVSDSVALTAQ